MSDPLTCAQHGTLVVDRPDLSTLIVTGPDRVSWLNGMVTADLSKMRPGDAAYGLALNKKGKLLSDLFVFALDDQLAVSVPTPLASSLCEELDHFLMMEDAEVVVGPATHRWVEAYGPQSARLVDATGRVRGALAAPVSISGTKGAVARIPAEAATDTVLVPDDDAALLTQEAFEEVRVDLGIPRFGADFDDSNYPHDIGLDDRAISYTKGCYLGQEVVLKLRSRGQPVKKLVRLVWAADGAAPAAGSEVTTEAGKSIGRVTTVATSRILKKPVGFAVVRRAEASQGATLVVGGTQATVIEAWGPVPSGA